MWIPRISDTPKLKVSTEMHSKAKCKLLFKLFMPTSSPLEQIIERTVNTYKQKWQKQKHPQQTTDEQKNPLKC